MPKSSMEELKGQVAAGQYAIDTGVVAADIFDKFALVRRVRRRLTAEDEAAAAERPGSLPRRQRGAAPSARRSSRPRPRRLK